MRTVTEIASWLILGALLVLVVTHARGFSQSVTTVGDESNKVLQTLTGAGTTMGS